MEQRKFIYATAANGLTVRIPAENFEQWQRAQDEIRAGKLQADPQMTEQLRSLMEKKSARRRSEFRAAPRPPVFAL